MFTLKKIWIWLKTYWQIPFVFIILIISSIYFGRDMSKVKDLFSANKKIYENELRELEKNRVKSNKRREEIEEKHGNKRQEIEEKYEEKRKENGEKAKEKLEDLNLKYKSDPKNLAKEINKKFGQNKKD